MSPHRDIKAVLQEAKAIGILPIGGWNLHDACTHLITVEPGLERWLAQAGIPGIYTQPQDAGLSHFASLVKTITYQQLSIKVGGAIFEKLLGALDCASANDLSPERVRDAAFGAKIDDNKSKQTINGVLCGLSEAKSKYLRSLATHFLDPESLQGVDLQALEEAELRKRLLRIDGLGPWSVHMFLLFKLQRQDVVAVGDLGIKRGIAKLHGLGPQWRSKKESEYAERVKKWKPYSSLGMCLMWRSEEIDNDVEADTEKTTTKKRKETSRASQSTGSEKRARRE